MKKLLFLFLLVAPAFGQTFSGYSGSDTFVLPPWRFCFGDDPGAHNACFTQSTFTDQTAFERGHLDYQYTVITISKLPTATTLLNKGRVYWVSDGTSAADCSAGGGFNFVLCVSNGVIWVPIGGGGGGGSSNPFLLRTNSPNGTVQNELVMYDNSNLDANGVATVQTAAIGSKGVIGVCISGCGTSGIATIGTYLAAQCIGDGAFTVGDLVSASPTTAGQCNDYGASINPAVQTIGRVSKANAGVGTSGQVDFFLGDLLAPGSTSGSGTVTNCGTPGGIAYYVTAGTAVGCDPNFTTDGSGNWTSHSGTVNDVTHAGFINFIQGAAPTAAPSNAVQIAAPTSVTGFTLYVPGSKPNSGNCANFTALAGQIQLTDAGAPCGTGNLPTSTLSTPSAPTLANQNAAGARSITYLIIGCQDGITCSYHSAQSATTNIANANASPQVKLSGYADTLYGYRCYQIWVTADSGGRTLGKIQSCAWKSYIDTGAAGNGLTAPNTNSTQVWQNPKPLPGCNIELGGVGDIDHQPCAPKATDDEFTWGDGTIVPGDSNDPFWTVVNQNSCTFSMTGGMFSMSCPSRGVGGNPHDVNCIFQSAPATPYTFVDLQYIHPITNGTMEAGMAFRESATGKIEMVAPYRDTAHFTGVLITKWTSATVLSSIAINGTTGDDVSGLNMQLKNDGTNITESSSNDGITYAQQFTEAKNAFFTTAPDQVGVCTDSANLVGKADWKYFRQTQ